MKKYIKKQLKLKKVRATLREKAVYNKDCNFPQMLQQILSYLLPLE